jgi:hypothetical protein
MCHGRCFAPTRLSSSVGSILCRRTASSFVWAGKATKDTTCPPGGTVTQGTNFDEVNCKSQLKVVPVAQHLCYAGGA